MIIYGGIDIGGTSIKIGFIDKGGTILCKGLMPVGKITSYSDFIEQLSNKTIICWKHLIIRTLSLVLGWAVPEELMYQWGK